MFDNFYTKLFR